MGENDLTRTFRELEEAVEVLLKQRQGNSEKHSVSSPTVPGRKSFGGDGVSGGVVDKEAIELIRRAIKRLKSLY